MNLLVRTARDWRRLANADVGYSIAFAGVVVAIEMLGRQSGTDLHDLLALVSFALLSVLVSVRHNRVPLPWVTAAGRSLRTLFTRLKQSTFEIGLDLRGEPRVKRGTPGIVLTLGSVFAVWAVLAVLFAADCPRHLREIVVQYCYVLYLVPLASLWCGIILLILLASFLPAAMIHDAFVAAHAIPGPRPHRREFWALSGYFMLLLVLGTFLPVAISLLVCGLFFAVYLVVCWLPSRASVRFLWRPAGTVRVRSLSWSRWVTWEFLLITLALHALVITACGDRLWGPPRRPETMPVTALLGMALAWMAPGALGALLVQMILGRLRDPARSARRTVSIAGDAPRLIRVEFVRRGWTVRFSETAGPIDVPLVFVSEKLKTERDEPRWPLPFTPADLSDPAFWLRIERRHEILLRRRLLSSLERLFKLAAGRPKRSGSGYWVAPHFWFVPGLMRDNQRDADEEVDLAEQSLLSGTVGPPYHRLLPRAVRHHAYRMLRALHVDLIFVEDGVGFQKFRKVLRVLFETFDVHGGRRIASEVDFRGLPGTRVLIHEFQFDEPFKSESYPEPKYDYLGRARILHVFRDRGEHEELVEPPFDASRTPAPLLVG